LQFKGTNLSTSLYSLRKLDPVCNVGQFSCGHNTWDKDINDFLLEDALNEQVKGLNVTWLCLKGAEIVGYTSLVSSNLIIKEFKWKTIFNIGEITRTEVPCALIAQFGVASDFQRQGVGKFMLSFIRGAAIDSEFGIKLLTLHVHKGNTAGETFWESMGFQVFDPKSGSDYRFMVHDLFSG